MAEQRDRDSRAKPSSLGDHTTARLDGSQSLGGALGLVVLGESGAQSHLLSPGAALVVGRAEGCDIVVADRALSRRHASIACVAPEGGGASVVHVTDFGSANGSKINGRALRPNEPAELLQGEILQLGATLIMLQRVSLGAVAPSAPDPASGAAPMVRVVERVAASHLSVLISGETGVGKEVMAETIHRMSPRKDKLLLRLNCAALTESLLETELFGHERGAFTGAVARKAGLLESADGGTVFLDEVGEMPAALQAKLLRVIEERRVLRVGGLQPKDIDVRFLSATHRDLERDVLSGRFRQDLYFRINGFTIHIPPLRARLSEIPDLAKRFLTDAARQLGRRTPTLSRAALAMLEAHAWPGNVRELKTVMERAVVLADGPEIAADQLVIGGAPPGDASAAELGAEPAAPLRADIDALERQRVLDALAAAGGNQTRAAKMLQISRSTLVARLEKFGVTRPRKRS